MSKSTLPSLTALRYPAAVWVLLIHLHHKLSFVAGEPYLKDHPALMALVERGFLGVTFFFVLSGFILAYNYDRPFKVKDFLVARAARILPVYYLSLLLAFPALLMQLAESHRWNLLYLQAPAVLVLIQSWLGISTFWNGPAWTLSCEAFFYLCFPVAMGLASQWCINHGYSVRKLLALVLVLAVLGCLPSFLLVRSFGFPTSAVQESFISEYNSPIFNGLLKLSRLRVWIGTWPAFRIFEFFIGVATYFLFKAQTQSTLASPKHLSKITGLAVAAFLLALLLSLRLPYTLLTSTMLAPVCAFIIYSVARKDSSELSSGSFPNTQRGELLGQCSYSLYLLHMPLLVYSIPLFRRIAEIWPSSRLSVFLVSGVVCCVVMTALSIFVFIRYEEPSKKWVRSFFARRDPQLSGKYVGI